MNGSAAVGTCDVGTNGAPAGDDGDCDAAAPGFEREAIAGSVGGGSGDVELLASAYEGGGMAYSLGAEPGALVSFSGTPMAEIRLEIEGLEDEFKSGRRMGSERCDGIYHGIEADRSLLACLLTPLSLV